MTTLKITLPHSADRRTKLNELRVNGLTVWFSYATPIAFRYRVYGATFEIRRPNAWGPTTGKHFKESGTNNFIELPDERFEPELEKAFRHVALESFKERIR